MITNKDQELVVRKLLISTKMIIDFMKAGCQIRAAIAPCSCSGQLCRAFMEICTKMPDHCSTFGCKNHGHSKVQEKQELLETLEKEYKYIFILCMSLLLFEMV